MAQFRVNDVVVVSVFDEDEIQRVQYRGRIFEVTSEAPDEYIFSSDESGELFIGNDDIIELVSGPSADAMTARAVDTSTTAIRTVGGGFTSVGVDWADIGRRMENLWGEVQPRQNVFATPENTDPVFIPVPEPQIPEYVTATELVLPALIGERSINIPIRDHAEVRNTERNITREDYLPQSNRRRLLRFQIGENIVSPCWERNIGIVYLDQLGRRWINSINQPNIASFSERITDISGVHWMLKSTYNERARGTAIPKVEIKPRKKLRHKYGKMPVVKTEDHYASKEYIA